MPAVSRVRDNLVCVNKKYHADETIARAAAMWSIEHNGGGKVPVLWVYKCPHCPGWHLTKHPGQDRFKVTL